LHRSPHTHRVAVHIRQHPVYEFLPAERCKLDLPLEPVQRLSDWTYLQAAAVMDVWSFLPGQSLTITDAGVNCTKL
jgi:hypothetical protein